MKKYIDTKAKQPNTCVLVKGLLGYTKIHVGGKGYYVDVKYSDSTGGHVPVRDLKMQPNQENVPSSKLDDMYASCFS